MNRIKSTKQDEIIVKDEKVSSVMRISAMKKLASDGFSDIIHPTLENWLIHPDFLLRDASISMLLRFWGQEKYISKIIEILHYDTDWSVRGTAAIALADFSEEFIEGEKYKPKIIKELLVSLIKDSDEFVQRDSYKGLYKLITDKELDFDKNIFDRIQDVDWQILEPYLKEYDLQKPN